MVATLFAATVIHYLNRSRTGDFMDRMVWCVLDLEFSICSISCSIKALYVLQQYIPTDSLFVVLQIIWISCFQCL